MKTMNGTRRERVGDGEGYAPEYLPFVQEVDDLAIDIETMAVGRSVQVVYSALQIAMATVMEHAAIQPVEVIDHLPVIMWWNGRRPSLDLPSSTGAKLDAGARQSRLHSPYEAEARRARESEGKS